MSSASDKFECGCLANGPYVFIPIATAWLGFIFFTIAAFSCKAFELSQSGYLGYGSSSFEYGYWGFHNSFQDECEEYGDSATFSAAFKFGRAISIMGFLLILFITIMTSFLACMRFPNQKSILYGLAIGFAIVTVMSLMLFSGVGEEACKNDGVDCKPQAAWVILPAFFILIGTAVVLVGLHQKNLLVPLNSSNNNTAGATNDNGKTIPHAEHTAREADPPMEQVTITEEVTEHEDGTRTKKTIKTTTKADGTQVVETTTEEEEAEK